MTLHSKLIDFSDKFTMVIKFEPWLFLVLCLCVIRIQFTERKQKYWGWLGLHFGCWKGWFIWLTNLSLLCYENVPTFECPYKIQGLFVLLWNKRLMLKSILKIFYVWNIYRVFTTVCNNCVYRFYLDCHCVLSA